MNMMEAEPPAGEPVERDPRRYSAVFEHLVESDDDVVGMVSYALYKQEKRDWLESWQEHRHGAPPSFDELDAFTHAHLTVGQRHRYRTAARQVLDAYAAQAFPGEGGEAPATAPVDLSQPLAERFDRLARRAEAAGRFWRPFVAGAVGGLVVGLIALGVVSYLLYGTPVAAAVEPLADALR